MQGKILRQMTNDELTKWLTKEVTGTTKRNIQKELDRRARRRAKKGDSNVK